MSGKELQRQLGVTYKTAYRMGQPHILGQHGCMLAGHVEPNESYVGGARKGGKRGREYLREPHVRQSISGRGPAGESGCCVPT